MTHEKELYKDIMEGDYIFADEPDQDESKLMNKFKTDTISDINCDERDQGDGETILEPDHPLLVRFQKALNEHLRKQIEHISSEIYEVETETKKKNIERDELGMKAYELQQMVSKQQKDLEDSFSELQTLSAAREELEHRFQDISQTHKDQQEALFKAKDDEIQLRNDVESINLLLQHLKKWEENVESDLLVNQRLYEKTKKDKSQLVQQKKEQDMMVYRLMSEVWKLEGELETMDMQLRVKEQEREKLAEAVARSNIDIEAAESEYRCLLHGWQAVIVAISARDKNFFIVNTELTELNQKLYDVISEIAQVKKLCTKEMNQNETLTLFKHRLERDINICKHQIETESRKRDNMEKILAETQKFAEQTEKECEKISTENLKKTNELKQLIRDMEQLGFEKCKWEEKILEKFQEQMTNDKASKYLGKILRDMRTKNRDMEISLATVENKSAKMAMEMEKQKTINTELEKMLAELNKQQDVVNKRILEYSDEINKCNSLIKRKQRDVDMLSSKIQDYKAKYGTAEKSPLELKISNLEQHIEHTMETNKDLQNFWLREQGHVVNLFEQRQEQMHETNLLRKQILILEQRNLKINDELNVHKQREEQMNRSINQLQNQLVMCTEMLNRKKGNKLGLDEANSILQYEFMAKLKDCEMGVIKLEYELAEIEEDSQSLTEELMEKNREALAWEAKWKLAEETKQNVNSERGQGGEIGNMKMEIHRMNIRHGQLKRAQEKLITDLEHCVARRDAIVTNAEAREKRIKGTQLKLIFGRKLDDARNRLKQIRNEIDVMEKKILDLGNEEMNMSSEIAKKEEENKLFQMQNDHVQENIEKAKTDKYMKLELLVMKQRKLKIYNELAKGRKPFLTYKLDSLLMYEYDKQKSINSKLQDIIEKLKSNHPEQVNTFERLFNSIILPRLCI